MTEGGRADDALLRAHVAGDPDAFAELLRRHRDRLWAVALRTLGDREEAADALQDALLSAHRGADRFRGDSAVTTEVDSVDLAVPEGPTVRITGCFDSQTS